MMILGNNKSASASVNMPTRAQIEERMFDRLLPSRAVAKATKHQPHKEKELNDD
jgi:hypothetical protein